MWYATISIGLLLVLFVWIAFKGPTTEWGDVKQAILFHQVRKYLLLIDERKTHIKYWRPSVLLLSGGGISYPLMDFCNNLKKGGLYVVGGVMLGEVEALHGTIDGVRSGFISAIDKMKLKAFPDVTVAQDYRTGCQNLMMLAGLGGMKPNTVVVPMISNSRVAKVPADAAAFYEGVSAKFASWPWDDDVAPDTGSFKDSLEFVSVVRDVLALQKNAVVACNFQNVDDTFVLSSHGRRISSERGITKASTPLLSDIADATYSSLPLPRRLSGTHSSRDRGYLDVWVLGDWNWGDLEGTLSLQLQLAYILHSKPTWNSKTKIRVINLIAPGKQDPIRKSVFYRFLGRFRSRGRL